MAAVVMRESKGGMGGGRREPGMDAARHAKPSTWMGRIGAVFPLESWLGHSERDVILTSPRGGGSAPREAETAKSWMNVRKAKLAMVYRSDGESGDRGRREAMDILLMSLHWLRRNRYIIPIGDDDVGHLVDLLESLQKGSSNGVGKLSTEVRECCFLLLQVWIRRRAADLLVERLAADGDPVSYQMRAAADAARWVLGDELAVDDAGDGGCLSAAVLFLGGLSTGSFCTKEMRQICHEAVLNALRKRSAAIVRSKKLPEAFAGVGYLLRTAHGPRLKSLFSALLSLWSSSWKVRFSLFGASSDIPSLARQEDELTMAMRLSDRAMATRSKTLKNQRLGGRKWLSVDEGMVLSRLLEYEGMILQREASAHWLSRRMVGLADARLLERLISTAIRGVGRLNEEEDDDDDDDEARGTKKGMEDVSVRCAGAMAAAGLLRGCCRGMDVRAKRSAVGRNHGGIDFLEGRGTILSDWAKVIVALEGSLIWAAGDAASSLTSPSSQSSASATSLGGTGISGHTGSRVSKQGSHVSRHVQGDFEEEEGRNNRSVPSSGSSSLDGGRSSRFVDHGGHGGGIAKAEEEDRRCRCWRRFVALACTLCESDSGPGLGFSPDMAELLIWFLLEECFGGLDRRVKEVAITDAVRLLQSQAPGHGGKKRSDSTVHGLDEWEEEDVLRPSDSSSPNASWDERLERHVASLIFRQAGGVARAVCEQHRQAGPNTKMRMAMRITAYARGLQNAKRVYDGLKGREEEKQGGKEKGKVMKSALWKMLEASFLAVCVLLECAFDVHAVQDMYAKSEDGEEGRREALAMASAAVEALDALSCVEFSRVYYAGYRELVERLFDIIIRERNNNDVNGNEVEQGVKKLVRRMPRYEDTLEWPGPVEIKPLKDFDWTKDEPHSSRIVFYMQVLAQCVERVSDEEFADRVAPTMFLYLQHPRKRMAMAAHQLFAAFLQRSTPLKPPVTKANGERRVGGKEDKLGVQSLREEHVVGKDTAGRQQVEECAGTVEGELPMAACVRDREDGDGQVLCAKGELLASLGERLASFYYARALEGLSRHVTPYEGLAIGYTSIVTRLVAGSPVILHALQSLVNEAAGAAKSSMERGRREMTAWLTRKRASYGGRVHDQKSDSITKEDDRMHGHGGDRDSNRTIAETVNKVANLDKTVFLSPGHVVNNRSWLLGSDDRSESFSADPHGEEEEDGEEVVGGGGPELEARLELPVFLQALVFVLIPLVDAHVLPKYLAMVAMLVEEMEDRSWQAAAMLELFRVVTDSHDYTRKPAMVEWYLRLKNRVQCKKGADITKDGRSAIGGGGRRRAVDSVDMVQEQQLMAVSKL